MCNYLSFLLLADSNLDRWPAALPVRRRLERQLSPPHCSAHEQQTHPGSDSISLVSSEGRSLVSLEAVRQAIFGALKAVQQGIGLQELETTLRHCYQAVLHYLPVASPELPHRSCLLQHLLWPPRHSPHMKLKHRSSAMLSSWCLAST